MPGGAGAAPDRIDTAVDGVSHLNIGRIAGTLRPAHVVQARSMNVSPAERAASQGLWLVEWLGFGKDGEVHSTYGRQHPRSGDAARRAA